jgi:CHAT domain-containing protein
LREAVYIARKAEMVYETLLSTGAKLNDYFSHIPYPKLASLYYQLYQITNNSKYLDSSYFYAEKEKITEIQLGKIKNISVNKAIAMNEKLLVENEILKLNNKYSGPVENLNVKATLFKHANWFANILNIKQLKSRIADDSTTILLFTHYNNPVGVEPTITCFAVSKNSFKHTSYTLTLQHALRYSIDSMMMSITNSDLKLFKLTSNLIYNELFAKAKGIIPITSKKLLICPVSRFRNFPFEVLIEDTLGNSFAKLNYLVKKYAISYLISPTLTYGDEPKITDKNIFVFTPNFQNANQSELPFNLNVSKWLTSTFSNTVFGAKTNKSNLLEGMNNAGMCHLATHASGFDDYTNESRIYTSDEPLMLNEVYKLQLKKNPFIVLTCCESDKGNLQFNVGNDNFSRAFTVAGASSVLATLWSIDDQASAELMKVFYQNLEKGMDKITALQQAKLTILNHPSLQSAAPFYWGASVLTGDVSKVDLHEKPNHYWLYFSVLAIVLLVFIIFRKKLFFKVMK